MRPTEARLPARADAGVFIPSGTRDLERAGIDVEVAPSQARWPSGSCAALGAHVRPGRRLHRSAGGRKRSVGHPIRWSRAGAGAGSSSPPAGSRRAARGLPRPGLPACLASRPACPPRPTCTSSRLPSSRTASMICWAAPRRCRRSSPISCRRDSQRSAHRWSRSRRRACRSTRMRSAWPPTTPSRTRRAPRGSFRAFRPASPIRRAPRKRWLPSGDAPFGARSPTPRRPAS